MFNLKACRQHTHGMINATMMEIKPTYITFFHKLFGVGQWVSILIKLVVGRPHLGFKGLTPPTYTCIIVC